MAEGDARQLVSGEHRRIREHDVAWAAYLADCEAWTTARDTAVRAAFDAAVAGSRRRGPEGDAIGRDAAIAAGRAFERGTPPPLWQGQDTGNAQRQYTDTDAKPGIIDRARDLLAVSPR